MAKKIMIQGTTSSAGKSLLATALCRIFYEDGYKVAPFKSQNMALNSFITDEGLEMGRAQVVQAEASCIKPKVAMNPILIKPTTDRKAQIIIEGKIYKNMDANQYHDFKNQVKGIVKKNFKKLEKAYEIIVLEGAGSPAEINLRDNDIVNMGMAEIADSPVIIIADIDRGGVFASIVGTIILLNENEKKRVKGIVINKFRGDIKLLKPGIKMLEDIIKIPVLGVIPYLDINIEDEDSVTEKFQKNKTNKEIKIIVIKMPRISNFTDFDAFAQYSDVSVEFATCSKELSNADIIILPGTKNTIDDLLFLKKKGFDKKIIELHKKNIPIIGICGGYQMLGKSINDPFHIESKFKKIKGFGLIEMETTLEKEKTTIQTKGKIVNAHGILKNMNNISIKGYEIHMGLSSYNEKFTFIKNKKGKSGYLKNNILGTYIHGIFDNNEFTQKLLNNIRVQKGLKTSENNLTYQEFKTKQYKKLADQIRKSLDMKKIYKILDNK